MNPLSPNQILRNLEHGYFMTHQEQSEAAQYIRQLQQAVLDEREACAKLCDNWGHDLVEGNYAAKTIRARSEPSPAFKNYMGDNWAGIV